MPAPILAPLDAPATHRALAVAGLCAFIAMCDGELAGQTIRTGDRLLVASGGPVVSGEVAVLAPRGHGRPVAGRVERGRLLGRFGEPCSAERWSVVGPVVAVVAAEASARMPAAVAAVAAVAA